MKLLLSSESAFDVVSIVSITHFHSVNSPSDKREKCGGQRRACYIEVTVGWFTRTVSDVILSVPGLRSARARSSESTGRTAFW